MPKISIITPCYNGAAFLERTIGSVLAQTLADWEMVIVDDGSSDETTQIADRFAERDERIRILTQPNGGVCRARNAGFAAASGESEYLVFLDQDDCLAPEMLAKMARYLDRTPGAGFAHCAFEIVDENDHPTSDPRDFGRYVFDGKGLAALRESERETPFEAIFWNCPIMPSASMIRRSAYEKTPGWDETFQNGNEDVDLFLHLALIAPMHFLPEKLVRYRAHPAQASRKIMQVQRQQISLYEKWLAPNGPAGERLGWLTETWRLYEGRLIPRLWLARAAENWHKGDWQESGKCLLRSAKHVALAHWLPLRAGKARTAIALQDTRPRVLHLVTKGVIAGAEQMLVDLASAHDSSRWDVRYATLFPAGEMNRRIAGRGQICYEFDYRRPIDLPKTALALARLIQREKIEILHTHLVHAGAAGILAKVLVGGKLRLVHTRHHADALYKFGGALGFPIKAKVDGFIARHHEIVCADAKAAVDVMVEREGVKPERARVTCSGVDIEGFRARVSPDARKRIREEFGVLPEEILLGVVAHLVPKKGHRYLVEAMPAIRASYPGARLLLAGQGIEQARIEAQVRLLGLGDAVIFAGFRADIPDILTALDLVVQPSLEEGLPVSLIEAMALGKPIVATTVSGIPELIEHGKTGILVPPADVPALANAITSLLADPGRRIEMGRAGEARARDHFAIERLARQYEDVWAELLGLSSPSAGTPAVPEQSSRRRKSA